MTPELEKLLERYHDGEVTKQEATEVEALLERDVLALEYLGSLDETAELLQTTIHHEVSALSFDGFWEGVQEGIAKEQAQAAEVAKASAAPERGFLAGVLTWLGEFIAENRAGLITAGATAAAVALVLSFMGPGAQNTQPGSQPGEGPAVVERHIIYVDSVDKADPESMVLVNSVQDIPGGDADGTKIIWLLPNDAQPEQNDDNDPSQADDTTNDDDDIEIVDEPL